MTSIVNENPVPLVVSDPFAAAGGKNFDPEVGMNPLMQPSETLPEVIETVGAASPVTHMR